MIKSNLLDIFALEDFIEVYFIFFLSYIVFSTNFRTLYSFLELNTKKKNQKKHNAQCQAGFRPTTTNMPGRPTQRGARAA
jgi:hypothetical protein